MVPDEEEVVCTTPAIYILRIFRHKEEVCTRIHTDYIYTRDSIYFYAGKKKDTAREKTGDNVVKCYRERIEGKCLL